MFSSIIIIEMGVITFLRSQCDITKIAVYFVLGFMGLLIWHFATLDISDENWKMLDEVVFESPNYPEMYTASTISLKFLIDKQFAGIKIKFYDWELQDLKDQANITDSEEEESLCEKFSIRFIGLNLQNSELCGALLKGYTILVDRNVNSREMQTLEIRVHLGSENLKCKWRFKVSQISMNKLHYKIQWERKSRKRRQSLLWQNEDENEVLEPLETPLIANGLKTSLINVPWQVSIRDMTRLPFFAKLRQCSPSSGQHFCGGSLISSNLVLSAAHCFFTSLELRSLSSLRIIVGCESTCFTSDHNESVQSHEIQSVYIHYGFNIYTYMNDMVLIKLKNSVMFNERVRPIQLSRIAENVAGKTAYISGWGRTILTKQESHSAALLHGKVILESNEYCTQEYPDISEASEHLTESILCSRFTFSTSSSGKGDSGGGLYSAEDSNLMGVISFILPASNMSYFQSVVFFENWIKLAVHF